MAIRLLSTTAISCKANTNNDVGEWQRRKKTGKLLQFFLCTGVWCRHESFLFYFPASFSSRLLELLMCLQKTLPMDLHTHILQLQKCVYNMPLAFFIFLLVSIYPFPAQPYKKFLYVFCVSTYALCKSSVCISNLSETVLMFLLKDVSI